MMGDTTDRIGILDGMRFMAAVTVMGFHYFYSGIYGGKILGAEYFPGFVGYFKYGYLGVELFFLISGYVIFRSAYSHGFSDFVLGRVRRLFPAFWVCVGITTICVSLIGHGRLQVGVYWTLAYELNFYLLVSLLLLFGLGGHLRAVFTTWAIWIGLCELVFKVHLPFSNGYYGYFAAGACFYMVQQHATWLSVFALSTSCVSAWLFSVGHASLTFAGRPQGISLQVVSCIVWAMFIFFSALASGRLPKMNGKLARVLGGVSYPLYLLHAHIGFAIISLCVSRTGQVAALAIAAALVLILSTVVHLWFEKHLSSTWGRFFSYTVEPLLVKLDHFAMGARKGVSGFMVRWGHR
jgi:peptidoglycan/LPS O-acetylase OafA/YrhL